MFTIIIFVVGCSYILCELKESMREFLVVTLHGGTTIAAICVATTDHIMQLGSGDQTVVLKRHTPTKSSNAQS